MGFRFRVLGLGVRVSGLGLLWWVFRGCRGLGVGLHRSDTARVQADGLPSTTQAIRSPATFAYVNPGNASIPRGIAYMADPYVYKESTGTMIPVQTLREGAELFTTIVGNTASSLRNTGGQILKSQSASGPDVGELNVALAGTSKTQPTLIGTLGRLFRSTVAQDM